MFHLGSNGRHSTRRRRSFRQPRPPHRRWPAFCGAVIDLIQILEVGPDISSNATPEDAAAALQKFGAQFEPPLTAAEKSMPDVVREDVETLGRQARFAVATKTAAPMNTPEFEDGADTSPYQHRQAMWSCGNPRYLHGVQV